VGDAEHPTEGLAKLGPVGGGAAPDQGEDILDGFFRGAAIVEDAEDKGEDASGVPVVQLFQRALIAMCYSREQGIIREVLVRHSPALVQAVRS
jgi:hypothetical protein